MESFTFNVEPAKPEDVPILSKFIILAERSGTKFGYWDCYFNGPLSNLHKNTEIINFEKMQEILEKMLLEDAHGPIYYKNFVVCKGENNDVIACAVSYHYPEVSFLTSIASFYKYAREMLHWNDEKCKSTEKSMSFMARAFPDFDWNGHCVFEDVFVAESHRGLGLGKKIVSYLLEKSNRDCVLCCYFGNNAALSLYQSLGFKIVGSKMSEEMAFAIGMDGLYVLQKRKS